MQKLIFPIIFCLLIVFLSGCGDWRLRSSDVDHVAIPEIFLGVDSDNGEKSLVYRELHSILSHRNLLASRKQAELQLVLGEYTFQKRPISVNRSGRTAEFQLTLKVPFKILSRQGQVLSQSTTLLSRSYRFSEQDILGESREEALLKKEMASETAQKILRQLNGYLTSQSRQSVDQPLTEQIL